jgi:hypothetical protein
MCRVLFAEFAILAHFEPFGVIFLVLFAVVIALLAFGTRQSNLNSHYFGTSLNYGENPSPMPPSFSEEAGFSRTQIRPQKR